MRKANDTAQIEGKLNTSEHRRQGAATCVANRTHGNGSRVNSASGLAAVATRWKETLLTQSPGCVRCACARCRPHSRFTLSAFLLSLAPLALSSLSLFLLVLQLLPPMSLVAVKSAETNFKDSILQLQEIFTHFDKLGSEGLNGSISTEKLGEALRESLGVSYSQQDLEDMVAAIDLNASGDVQFNEFLKMMDQARTDSELLAGGDGRPKDEDAEEDAVAAGGDGGGAGDGEEKESPEDRAKAKRKALEQEALQAEAEYVMTRDDIKAIFKVFDTDKDGRVSAAELQAMLVAQGEKYSEEEVHAMIHLVDPSNSGMISYQAFVRLMMSPED